jgi:hypothetical protein
MTQRPEIEVTRQVPFNVVIHSWLASEWEKHDYDSVRSITDPVIIKHPNFNDPYENTVRSFLLFKGRHVMCQPVLALAHWQEVKIYKRDVPRIYACASPDDWGVISNNTFHVSEILTNIYPAIKTDFQRSATIRQIASTLNENSTFDGLILIGSGVNSPFTIIEGCHRFTAINHVLSGKGDDALISKTAFLGISPHMNRYTFHIERVLPNIK